MVELLTEKGMKEEDACTIVNTYAKYPELFVEYMVHEELELLLPGEDDNPWKDGFVTFASFCFFGSFPLLPYLIFGYTEVMQDDALFTASCICSALTFFLIGVVKTTFTTQAWWKGGGEVLLTGCFIALVAYGIGAAIEFALFSQTGHSDDNCGTLSNRTV